MNNFLFSRALGSVSQQALARAQHDRLVHSLQAAENIRLTYRSKEQQAAGNEKLKDDALKTKDVAHPAGVNSITIDKFEGR